MLTSLPDDILHEIVEQLRYAVSESDYPLAEENDVETFLKSGWTSYSSTRFHLSSLSTTCWRLRPIAERILYREIHVDNVGWIALSERGWHNGKLQAHPAGSLSLLARTVQERPALASLIRSVDLRWCDGSGKGARQQVQELIRSCDRVTRVAVSEIDEELLDILEPVKLGIHSFSALCASRNVERIISCFPHLRDLHLFLHGVRSPVRTPILTHSIRRMRFNLHVLGERFGGTCQSVLALAGSSVEELIVENGVHVRGQPYPPLPLLEAPIYGQLRSLSVKDVDLFEPITYPSIFTSMPSLQHLHIMRCRILPPGALLGVPASIVSMSFSLYGAGEPDLFLCSLAHCIRLCISSRRCLAGIRVETRRSKDYPGNLIPLRDLCIADDVGFEEVSDNNSHTSPKVTVFFF
ncbi:hypothetical protein V5O48_002807 [Marasmius crinis-equi]|uniref:F-box domain-containing protein n=1 Tax=Marasmius crinis-equi TaxID=585013 RepID=A0ABR3FVN3_9AGAR